MLKKMMFITTLALLITACGEKELSPADKRAQIAMAEQELVEVRNKAVTCYYHKSYDKERNCSELDAQVEELIKKVEQYKQ